ncbi:MAG: sigma 54-interacting transcriptional regulator [Flavobacteriaceae bacterium]|nr:sigma 54-interacting transcriptional regulator [Flavobacteriaceae bacterium]
MEELQDIKSRFEIIGNNQQLNRVLQKAVRVSSSDISVLVTGESGVGKEIIPKIIHQYSKRKHSKLIAINCGAIPEGTIDSELFGHEKGSFTGAQSTRKGYFEVADGGTIFLDEVGELPLTTQVRLLRVLENGEFMKVGSSEVQKTNVRIVAATNLNMQTAIKKGKFREDLYYRLSTVELFLPALRERKDDIYLLFRKFAIDFADKYKMPIIRLQDDAVALLEEYRFPGNIRQLRNIVEQISVVEESRNISAYQLKEYFPNWNLGMSPAVVSSSSSESGDDSFSKERDVIYKMIFELKKELNDLKKMTFEFMGRKPEDQDASQYVEEPKYIEEETKLLPVSADGDDLAYARLTPKDEVYDESEFVDATNVEPESLSLHKKEMEMIVKSLEKYKGKRKLAADELGISERTLYRKIKQFDL